MSNVSLEYRNESEATLAIYHTLGGDVTTRTKMHAGWISDSTSVEVEGMIDDVGDYDPVIFMLDDARFGADYNSSRNAVRNLGADGIVPDQAIDMEAAPRSTMRSHLGDVHRLENWVYHQRDLADPFKALAGAQERRDERPPAVATELPAEFVGFDWIEGLRSPEQSRDHELRLSTTLLSRVKER